jgi:predicted DsbA family dithiol-disulfide isomerase
MAEQIKLEIWADYTCPYVYRAAVMLREVKNAYGDRLQLEWHWFPLEQVNSIQGPEWKLWEQPDEYRSKGLWAFRAAEAARKQGREAFERFHMALLNARHVDNADIADRALLMDLARGTGLDPELFQWDLADRSLMAKIGEDYERGVQEHGIWGTPTLVFDGDQSAYLKLRPAPPAEECVKAFDELRDVINRPYVIEVKRPH